MDKANEGPSLAQIQADQDFVRAVPAAVGAAILGALLWAAFGYFTGMSLGLVAILIGVLVGYAVRHVGKGVDARFGYLGAACSALGWALGTWLCDVALLAKQVDRPIMDVLGNVGGGEPESRGAGKRCDGPAVPRHRGLGGLSLLLPLPQDRLSQTR